MVTLISQDLNEFDLHARAIMGLPIPQIALRGPSASAVLLADRDLAKFRYEGQAQALSTPGEAVDLRIFAKPTARPIAAWAWRWPARRTPTAPAASLPRRPASCRSSTRIKAQAAL